MIKGDIISPKLFTACLESIFRSLDWENKGININGERFNHLRFADDIVCIEDNLDEIENMLRELAEASKKCGLKMNMQKTKIVRNLHVPHRTISVNGIQIEEVEEYIYLGQRFSLKEKSQEQEIKRRIKLGWCQYGKLSNIMRGNIPICLKRKVFNQCITPTIVYGAETWAMTTKLEKKIAAAQHNMERNMLGITYKDRKTNKWVREQTKTKTS